MPKTLLFSGQGDAFQASTANTTQYFIVGGSGPQLPDTVESHQQLINRYGGTYSNFTLSLSANSIAGGSTVFNFRKNGANGNMSISVPASSTGNFSESTLNTDTVAAGDLVNLQSVPGAATGTFTLVTTALTFLNTDNTDTVCKLVHASLDVASAASTTYYYPLAGGSDNNLVTNESGAKCRIRKAATLKNFALVIQTNARSTSTVFQTRKAAVDANLTISIPSGSTGLFEDTTHTDSMAVADDWNFRMTTGTGTGNFQFSIASFDCVSTDGWFPIIIAAPDIAHTQADAVTQFFPVGGYIYGNTTEATVDEKVSGSFTLAELTINVFANDIAAVSTVTLDVNAVASTLVASITSSGTGVFSDSTNTVSVKRGDLLDIKVVATSVTGNHSLNYPYIAVWAKEVTKLYFHNATSTVTGTLPSTSQSAQGAPATTADAVTVNRSMNTTIGTAQTSKAISFTSAQHKVYYTRFVSDTLQNNTTISANTWNFAFAASEASLSANFPCSGSAQAINVTCYVWRPGTGAKVGNILDGNSAASYTEPSALGTEKSLFGTFSGSAVTANAGDVICMEIYFTITNTASSTGTFFYDGTTETNVNGTTVSNHASYIETPQALTFGTPSTGNNVTISLTETVTISDGLAIVRGKIRTVAQTVTISSTPARLSAKNKALTETVTISSTVARARGIVKTLTETVTISSTVARLAAKIRARTETIVISESLARLAGKSRSLSQTITVSDSVARVKGIVRAISQTVTISESLARLAAKIRARTETITISSTVAKLAAKNKALTETVTISSTVARVRGVVKTLTETVTVSDSLARLAAKIRTRTETITISSTVAKLAAKTRTLTETITISDSVARTVARAVVRTLTETISVSDSLARLAAKTRPLTETITIASTPARVKSTIRAISETVTVSDSLSRLAAKIRTLTETVTATSTVARLAAKIRTITQTTTISDSLSYTKSGVQNIVRSLIETITISSTVTRLSAKTRTLSETTTLSDTPTRLAGKIRALATQTVTIGTGTATRTRGIVRAISDSLTSSTTLARLAKKIRSVTSTVTITDSVTGQGPSTPIQPKAPPSSTQSILAQEIRHPIPLNAKYLQRILLETVHIKDSVVIEVRHVSKAIKIARVKRVARILDLVRIIDDTYRPNR